MTKKDFYSEDLKTPKFIAAYPDLIVSKPAYNKPEKLVYSVTMMFPKATTDLTVITNAIKALAMKVFGADVNMQYIALPITDGDEPNQKGVVVEAFKGHYIMRAKSVFPPAVFNIDRTPIKDQAFVSSGNVMQAIIAFHAYTDPKNGIHVYVQSAYKHSDGEPLALGSGTVVTADDWAEEAKEAQGAMPSNAGGVAGMF